MIAALCAWHEGHVRATRELERRLDAGENLLVAAPGLVEAYAVLTRLPPPHRLSPADCWTLLESNFFRSDVEIVVLGPREYERLLREAPKQGTAGGHIYDAVSIACGAAAGAESLVTLNERQLRPLAEPGIEIVVPA
jgi:predicted nucleic acid-binding protein